MLFSPAATVHFLCGGHVVENLVSSFGCIILYFNGLFKLHFKFVLLSIFWGGQHLRILMSKPTLDKTGCSQITGYTNNHGLRFMEGVKAKAHKPVKNTS